MAAEEYELSKSLLNNAERTSHEDNAPDLDEGDDDSEGSFDLDQELGLGQASNLKRNRRM